MLGKEGLREFVLVVEQGSYTAAAKKLNVSTSYVSRQVMRLEDRLDIRLLQRTTRTVHLTEMGKLYYERSRAILDQLDQLNSEIAVLQDRPKGHIRVTTGTEYAERFVVPAIGKFMEQYPEVTIELESSMRMIDIIEEGFDIAIRMSPTVNASLIARKIEPSRIMVCASPSYLDKHGRPESPDELHEHNCLSFPGMPWRFKYPDRIQEIKVSGSWTSDSGPALVTAARLGHGIVRFSDFYFTEFLKSGELEILLEDYEIDDAAFWIIYPNRQHLPTRVRYLVDFLLKELSGITSNKLH